MFVLQYEWGIQHVLLGIIGKIFIPIENVYLHFMERK